MLRYVPDHRPADNFLLSVHSRLPISPLMASYWISHWPVDISQVGTLCADVFSLMSSLCNFILPPTEPWYLSIGCQLACRCLPIGI